MISYLLKINGISKFTHILHIQTLVSCYYISQCLFHKILYHFEGLEHMNN